MGETLSESYNLDKELPREGGKRFNILSDGAQNLRYFPSLGEGIVQKGYDDINDLYQHGPHRHWEADFYVARSIRSMVWGTLAHVMYSRLLSTLLPYLEQGSPLIEAIDMPLTSDFYKTDSLIGVSLTEEQDTFMLTGSALLLGASEALFREIDADPNHFYRPLVQQVASTHNFYKEKHAERRERRRELSPSYTERQRPPLGHWREMWHEGMVDNLTSARKSIEMRRRARRNINAHKIGHTALSDIEKLNWLTSINLETLKIIRDEGHRYGGMEETGHANNPTCNFAHPSLQDGPWEIRHFCAGQYVLRSPYLAERLDADRSFELMGLPCDQGAFDAGLALLAIGQKLSDELNYKDGPSKLE